MNAITDITVQQHGTRVELSTRDRHEIIRELYEYLRGYAELVNNPAVCPRQYALDMTATCLPTTEEEVLRVVDAWPAERPATASRAETCAGMKG